MRSAESAERGDGPAGERVAASRPQLRNQAEVGRALDRHYPPALRQAGLGGTTVLDILVSPSGVPRQATIVRSSGNAQLDQASLEVFRSARFHPGSVKPPGGSVPCRVPMWIVMPVSFQVR